MELEDFVADSDSDPDQLGNPHFSIWDVKIPGEVSVAAVRKLVFTTEEGRQNFVAKFGDAIPCAVAPSEDLAVNPRPGDKQAVANATWNFLALKSDTNRSVQSYSKKTSATVWQ